MTERRKLPTGAIRYYISDTRPGDITGQLRDEFGAWHVLAPNGHKIGTY